MKLYQVLWMVLFSLLVVSCDEGLAPEPQIQKQQEGFGGKIIFSGDWPSSVTRTHLIIFKNPLNSPADFSLLNLAYVSLEIPKGVSEYNYSTLDSAFFPPAGKPGAGSYSYIAVAQQILPVMTLNRADWFIAAFYHLPGTDTIPGTVTVPKEQFINNINIICDFNAPPPQPPG